MVFRKVNLLFVLFSVLTIFSACQKDETEDTDMTAKGSARIEITDAPIDDANVSGTFVTIAEVKVDGQSIEGFNKTTIDILALQNGNTKVLLDTELEAKSYSEITLVLDFDNDMNGNSPGCYVEETGGDARHKLTATSNEIKVRQDFAIETTSQANFVLDFDLRKCIQKQDDATDKYDFVSAAELEAGVRVVTKNNTGVIKGKCNDNVSNSDKVVVYAYKKGTYNRDMELEGQGQSNIEFSNAVTSSAVDANGNYEMHFLEEGDYEVYYCSYKENSSGEMELQGTLEFDIITSLMINSVTVDAEASVAVDVAVTGLLPI